MYCTKAQFRMAFRVAFKYKIPGKRLPFGMLLESRKP